MNKPSLSDYGTYDESTVPQLWDGVVGAWCPSLGPTGSRLHDFSRYGNWGTLTNMDPASDWVVDGGQYALDFDGSNDYVTFGNPPVLNTMVSLTVAFWVYHRSASFFELGKYRSSGYGFLIYGAPATGFQFDGRDGGGYLSSGASGPYNQNQWYHVIGRKAGNVWSIAVNGVQKNSTTTGTGTTAMSNSNPFEIGRLLADASPEGYLNGLMDDVVIWSRAITAGEMWQLYQLGRGGMFQRRRLRRAYVSEAGNRRRRLICGAEC